MVLIIWFCLVLWLGLILWFGLVLWLSLVLVCLDILGMLCEARALSELTKGALTDTKPNWPPELLRSGPD